MIKINFSGFTFVELMFTVSIMSLITIYSVFYFNSYVDGKRLESELSFINGDIDLLNKKVKNKEIYDYELNFSGDLFYTYKLDTIYNPFVLNFLFDDSTKSFTFSTNDTNTGSWNLKIYAKDKIIYNKILSNSDSFTGKFDSYKDYKILSNLNGNNDEMGFSYFSDDNVDFSGNLLKFIGPNGVIIKNKNNRLSIFSGGINIPSIDLLFEHNGLQKTLNFNAN